MRGVAGVAGGDECGGQCCEVDLPDGGGGERSGVEGWEEGFPVGAERAGEDGV